MTFFDSLLVAVFGMAIVFLVLVSLSFVVTIQSRFLTLLHSDKSFFGKNRNNELKAASNQINVKAKDETSGKVADQSQGIPEIQTEFCEYDTGVVSGQLLLVDVDEKTAALIMAIVSDESGIPLSELCFRQIKAIS